MMYDFRPNSRLRDERPPMTNIFYIHGFASCFEPDKSKIRSLSKFGKVDGITVDYTQNPGTISEMLSAAISTKEPQLLVGTSLGGYWSAVLGKELSIPFVAINPAIAPHRSLRKYLGPGVTHFGQPFELSAETVGAYERIAFPTSRLGLVVVDEGDQVISAAETVAAVQSGMEVIKFPGGSHRFDHMEELVAELGKRLFHGGAAIQGACSLGP